MQKLALMFKALSDETRLQILGLLVLHGELCVCDVEGLLEISQSKASRHLRYLWNAALVESRRAGRWMYYRLPDAPSATQRAILDAVEVALEGPLRADLEDRLGAWFSQKERAAGKHCAP